MTNLVFRFLSLCARLRIRHDSKRHNIILEVNHYKSGSEIIEIKYVTSFCMKNLKITCKHEKKSYRERIKTMILIFKDSFDNLMSSLSILFGLILRKIPCSMT
ncbi:hypothetical protein HZS_1698 [Henneguya salminicola]|nr:hypothetical protein HZS_1698 [Henneguya salminicola]